MKKIIIHDIALSCLFAWVGLMIIEAVKPRFAVTALPVHAFLVTAIALWGIGLVRPQK